MLRKLNSLLKKVKKLEIIKREFEDEIKKIKRSPDGICKEDLDLKTIINMVKFDNLSAFDRFFQKSLYRILHGLWSADVLDFIQRDAYYCGTTEYGAVDYQRLIKSSIIAEDGSLALYETTQCTNL